jgi:hypothetical protein
VIIDTLPDEEWFTQIRNWRDPEFGAADSWYWYLDGVGTVPLQEPLPKRVEESKRELNAYPMTNATTPHAQPPDQPHDVGSGSPVDEPDGDDGAGGDVRALTDHLRERGLTVGE